MGDTRESGVVPASGGGVPTAEVLKGCHDILGAAAVIVVNLEYVTGTAGPDNRAALEDARASVSRIVELTHAIRRAHERSVGAPEAAIARST